MSAILVYFLYFSFFHNLLLKLDISIPVHSLKYGAIYILVNLYINLRCEGIDIGFGISYRLSIHDINNIRNNMQVPTNKQKSW